MLTMSAMSGSQAGYYLGLAREDYYTQGGEPPGYWLGAGAGAIGLGGAVEPNHLYNLFDGMDPEGTRPLVQLQSHRGKQEHRPGWDLTFSAPKSVSVLWSQTDSETRVLIQDAHAQAVKAALSYLQDTAAVSRRGHGGHNLERAGLIVAGFEHSTSRALDPQLHTHALVMNIGVGLDAKTRTLSSLSLFDSKMAAGALYRAELASRMEILGFPVERKRSWFEVTGVSKDLIDTFSKRRAAIEAELERKGIGSAKAAAVAAIETREAKEATSRENLFREWRAEGRAHGWSTAEAKGLRGRFEPKYDKEKELTEALEVATTRLTDSVAHFTERDFTRLLAEEAQGRGLNAIDVREGATRHLADSPEIVRLGVVQGQARFTTREMLELEESLLSCASELRQLGGRSLKAETVITVLSQQDTLSEEQLKAVWHITVETEGIAVVSGMAGTGKTQMLDFARKAWEAEGFKVVGATLMAKAAMELEMGAHIPSSTIARLLHDMGGGKGLLDDKTILVIDEAGMIATPLMAALAGYCQRAGAKPVLIGDEKQIQPLGPGAPFTELGDRIGRAALTDIRRQTDAWAIKVVKDIVAGNSREALIELARRGFVTVDDTKSEAIQSLISRWRADGIPLRDSLILAGTRAEVHSLNKLAQAVRSSAGELRGEPVPIADQVVFEQDRVMFLKNSKTRGVRNGDRGTAIRTDLDSKTIRVRLDSGETVSVCTSDYPHLELGYAGTTHKAQGATSQVAYILAGGSMQDRELSYVQASRARKETHFFTTRIDGGDELAQIAAEMQRSRRKQMASSLVPDGTHELDR